MRFLDLRAPSLLAPLALLGLLALGSTGCVRKIVVDGQIQAFRQASVSFETAGDYEYARGAMSAGLLQFEGMHALSPDNADALYMLAKSHAGNAQLFIEDEMQAAELAGKDDATEYHRKRARTAYDRAVFFGSLLMDQTAPGFVRARRTAESLHKWLAENFTRKEDAATLFWVGLPWLARADLMKGDDEEGPQFIADVFVGVELLERARELDFSVEHYNALTALGAYHARNALAEPEEGRRMFELALHETKGRDLVVLFNFARTYACTKGDVSLYRQLLKRVLEAGDVDPEQRLPNIAAKRFAARWLDRRWAKERCGFDLGAR
jgi:hypothetical protein